MLQSLGHTNLMTGFWSKEMSKSKQKKIFAEPDYEVGRGKETSLPHDVRGRVGELGGSPPWGQP